MIDTITKFLYGLSYTDLVIKAHNLKEENEYIKMREHRDTQKIKHLQKQVDRQKHLRIYK